MNRTSWPVRLVWTGVMVLALIGIAAATRRALILLFGIGVSPVAQLDTGFAQHPVLTFVHIIPGALFMVLGPFQFMPSIRARRLWQHRWSGRVFVAAGYVVGVSALAMSWQMSIGGAMRKKLAALEKRLAARAADPFQRSRASSVRASERTIVVAKGR